MTSVMTSAAVREERRDLCCPVCYELFTQPKVLTCGHLLCHHCLVSWMDKQPDAACPQCRCPILARKDRASAGSLEDTASSFPTDFRMETWVASYRLLSQDHECQACVSQGATFICTTCRDFFCADCAVIHKRTSVTHHHTVEQLSSLTPEKLASSFPTSCATHKDKLCKVFCPTHGASICLLCLTTDHKQCPDLGHLQVKIEEARAMLANTRDKLHAEEAHLSQAIQQLDQHLLDMKERVEASAAEIEAMCERLESSVRDCQKRLNDLLHRAYDDVEEAVNEAKTCLSHGHGNLAIHYRFLERANEADSPDDVIGMSSSLKTRVDRLVGSFVLPPDAKVVSRFSLLIDQRAVACVEQQIAQLGQLKVFPADLRAQPAKPVTWTFHEEKKCASVVLSNNQQTAERTNRFGDGVVLSSEPMEVNCLYQVRVDKRERWITSGIYLGVVTGNPDGFEDLTSSVVIHPNWVMVNGRERASRVGFSLCEARKGSHVGLMLDKDRTLHLYRDGRHLGEVEPHLPHPCYFMVDLYWCWKKVTALPVQYMK